MNFELWTVYVATVLVFMITPGPSHILMVSVSMSNGFKRSLATAAGDLTANAIQITLVGCGLATILMTFRYGFFIIKCLGVAYLMWIGIKTVISSFKRKPIADMNASESVKKLWLRGFVTSAANPKAIVFFAALLPQFIDFHEPMAVQLLLLGATYIVIDGLFLSVYGLGSYWMVRKLQNTFRPMVDRICGISLIGAAVLLGLKSSMES